MEIKKIIVFQINIDGAPLAQQFYLFRELLKEAVLELDDNQTLQLGVDLWWEYSRSHPYSTISSWTKGKRKVRKVGDNYFIKKTHSRLV